MNRLNPQAIIQQAMNNSQMMQYPVVRNTIEMHQRKDTQGLNELASNVCREKGTTKEEVAKQIKSQFGIN